MHLAPPVCAFSGTQTIELLAHRPALLRGEDVLDDEEALGIQKRALLR